MRKSVFSIEAKKRTLKKVLLFFKLLKNKKLKLKEKVQVKSYCHQLYLFNIVHYSIWKEIFRPSCKW